jgi:hypothetical protein
MGRSQKAGSSNLRERVRLGPRYQFSQAGMIGHEQRFRGRVLEPLGAIPGHVLDCRQRAVHEEEEIQPAMADDGVVGAFDDAGERAQGAGDGAIAVRKDVTLAADGVVSRRHVERLLHVGSVEVVVRPGAEGGKSHLVPQVGAEIGQVVDVEARIDVVRRGDDVVPDGATGCFRLWGDGEVRRRREDEGFVEELVVAALFGPGIDFGDEALVQGEDGLEVVQRSNGGCWCSLA